MTLEDTVPSEISQSQEDNAVRFHFSEGPHSEGQKAEWWVPGLGEGNGC